MLRPACCVLCSRPGRACSGARGMPWWRARAAMEGKGCTVGAREGRSRTKLWAAPAASVKHTAGCPELRIATERSFLHRTHHQHGIS